MMRLASSLTAWLIALTLSIGLALTFDGVSRPGDAVAALFALPGHDPFLADLITKLRLPRVVAAGISGALLAIAGAGIQLMFRNPLAEPGLIGVSGGAALAAALALNFGLSMGPVTLIAFGGGIAALWLARRLCGTDLSGSRLILAGIAVNALMASLLMLLITTLSDGSLRTITFWLMGSFSATDWLHAGTMLVVAAPVWLLLRAQAPFLNTLQLGESAAFHSGFEVGRGLVGVALLAALATALVVSSVGMIGFVGLLGPHVARLMVGAEARRLLALSPAVGALIAVLADWAARVAVAPAELPVGVITSLIGAPFFLWLLNRHGQRS